MPIRIGVPLRHFYSRREVNSTLFEVGSLLYSFILGPQLEKLMLSPCLIDDDLNGIIKAQTAGENGFIGFCIRSLSSGEAKTSLGNSRFLAKTQSLNNI